jgi:hypothetical protein
MSPQTPTRPRSERPLGGVAPDPISEKKKSTQTELSDLPHFSFPKLFKNSKFCMIYLALIPVMNYYA